MPKRRPDCPVNAFAVQWIFLCTGSGAGEKEGKADNRFYAFPVPARAGLLSLKRLEVNSCLCGMVFTGQRGCAAYRMKISGASPAGTWLQWLKRYVLKKEPNNAGINLGCSGLYRARFGRLTERRRSMAILANLFHYNERPLFVKIDNGGNLNGEAVMDAFAEYNVIPLISPPYYPQYNGSLESTQGFFKSALDASLPLSRNVDLDEMTLHARLAAHDLNHQAKEILKNKIPCQVFHDLNKKKYTIPERRDIYDWINETQETILKEVEFSEADNASKRMVATARRKAIEMWLLKNKMIRLTKNGKSVTLFSD